MSRNGTHSEGRTRTEWILSPLPLPLGYVSLDGTP